MDRAVSRARAAEAFRSSPRSVLAVLDPDGGGGPFVARRDDETRERLAAFTRAAVTFEVRPDFAAFTAAMESAARQLRAACAQWARTRRTAERAQAERSRRAERRPVDLAAQRRIRSGQLRVARRAARRARRAGAVPR